MDGAQETVGMPGPVSASVGTVSVNTVSLNSCAALSPEQQSWHSDSLESLIWQRQDL